MSGFCMSDHFRKDYGSADYRAVYEGYIDQIVRDEERRDALKRRWAVNLKFRNEFSGTCEKTDPTGDARYCYHKRRMHHLEREIQNLDGMIEFHFGILRALRTPKPQRARQITSDGYVKTGKFKMIDGERVSVLEKIE
jgi:hypothetical protein